jgi:hypothetical protein
MLRSYFVLSFAVTNLLFAASNPPRINANRGVVPELRWVSSLSSVERQKIG